MMAFTETILETRPHDACAPDCSCKTVCPPDCSCLQAQENSCSRAITITINAIGILVAILASYMIISTDSRLYLVFWVAYSVLRRMMTKNKDVDKKYFKSD